MRPVSVMLSWRAALALWMLLAICTLAACRGPGAGSSAGPSTAPGLIDEAAAVRLVLAQDERFRGIGPMDQDLIGQSSWYEVVTTQSGWQVTVRIGWGDCPSGCIDEHRWVYNVTTDGEVTLDSESGSPIPTAAGVRGTVTKGPICPVEHDPPDPDCADRPVSGAVLLIEDASGAEVTRVTSAADGSFSAVLAPGAYRLVPQPVDGLLGTAPPMEFRLEVGEPAPELLVSYDTGIR